jgi:hypothetical protein
MDAAPFRKDETPYLIFKCTKCRQFMYVKTTQKGKKCLRCGKTHSVSKILDTGEIVDGMTTAVEAVKQKQNEFGISELGHAPELRALDDFKVAGPPSQNKNVEQNEGDNDQEEEFSEQFTLMLKEIASTYKSFPGYVIEVMADNFMIPHSQLKFLKRQFETKGILKKLSDNSYKVSL